MPYRDRNQRLAASRAHHARYRPSPVPLPQPDSALPPYGELVTSDDGTQIQCHVCGRWFGQLLKPQPGHAADDRYQHQQRSAGNESSW
jgi:hypothetical protein